MKTFIVLGMHRTCTSLVALGLSKKIVMGSLGDPLFNSPTQTHYEGYGENSKFVHLNDRILYAAGGSCFDPPPEHSILAQRSSFEHEIVDLLQEASQGRDIWGWKDPRTTLTIRLYLPHVVNPNFVACFRDPPSIARNLQRWDDLEWNQALKIARIYNARLLAFLAEFSDLGTWDPEY